MIGIALGVSGVLAAAVSGWIVDSFGFGVHHVVLAVICLVGLLRLARMTETVAVATGTGTETMKK